MKKYGPILIILLLALLIRIAADFEFRKFPVFDHPQLDEMEYDSWAADIARGHVLWEYIPIHSPAYAFFLFSSGKLFPPPYLSARLFQAIISTLSVLLIYLLTWKIFDDRSALFSAALSGFFWPMVYFQARLLPPTLNIFFILLSLLLALGAQKHPLRSGFFSGLCLGIAALFWPLPLAMAPALLIWFWASLGTRRSLAPVFLFILGIALCLAPVALQNYRAEKDLVLLQKNFGMNFYLGNNQDSPGIPYLRPGGDWDQLQSMPVREAGIENPAAQNKFYLNKWSSWAIRHPGSWLNLLVRKTKLLFDNREIIASFDPGFYRARMISLRACLFNSALVFALGLIGLFSAPPRKEKFLLLSLGLLFFGTALVLTLISSRYRLGFMALLMIPAGYGVNEIYSALKSKNELRFWGLLILAAVFYALSAIPLPRIPDQSGYEWVHFGQAWKESEQYDKARQSFKTALSYKNVRAGAWLGLGQLAMREGDMDEAEDDVHTSLSIDPGCAQAHMVSGSIMLVKNNLPGAKQEFEAAINLRPQYVYGWAGYADALIRLGDLDQAEKTIDKIVKLRPDLPDALLLRAKVQLVRGNKDQVLKLLKQYLLERPDDQTIRRLVQENESQ